ncbi:MAG: Holliday junction resolvase RuvX [Chloroflexota bacterium]
MIGRLLGIDHGTVRIGLAISDALGISARELDIIPNNDDTFTEINRIAREQNAVGLVIGIPTDERNPKQSTIVLQWVKELREATTLPIKLWDEVLSSADALEMAKELRRKQGDPIDDLAARIILQSYINALSDGLATPHGS